MSSARIMKMSQWPRPYLRRGDYGITPPPRNVKKNFSKYCICLYNKVVYEDAHKQAKLLPPDTFLSRKNAFAAGAGRTPLGELTALFHADPLLGP